VAGAAGITIHDIHHRNSFMLFYVGVQFVVTFSAFKPLHVIRFVPEDSFFTDHDITMSEGFRNG
jgi:hypothetical protein